MKIRKSNPCPQCPPDAPYEEPEPYNPACICNKPMLLYIPAGQHIHCPVHPDVVIYSSSPMCMSTGLDYTHDASKDLTYDSTKPFGTMTGANILSGKITC